MTDQLILVANDVANPDMDPLLVAVYLIGVIKKLIKLIAG